MNNGKDLFLYNRSILDADSYKRMLSLEDQWIGGIRSSIQHTRKAIESRKEFQREFKNLLLEDLEASSEDADYISKQMSMTEFQVILREFAVDGLTEAQSFFPIIPRLPLAAQMPILRVLIDEFGCGNFQQAHSRLYHQLLCELGMPTDIESYLDTLNPESYAFLNIFYWLTNRAPHIEYFLGALAYLESTIPSSFQCFAEACQRLNITSDKYYTEHIHIDDFHAKDVLRSIWEVDAAIGVDYTKVWTGVQISSFITERAFTAAVEKSKVKANEETDYIALGDNLLSEVPLVGSAHDSTSVVIESQGRKYQLPGACPHRGGKLACGTIDKKRGTITCPLHFSKFEIASGKHLSGPESVGLQIIEITNDTKNTHEASRQPVSI